MNLVTSHCHWWIALSGILEEGNPRYMDDWASWRPVKDADSTIHSAIYTLDSNVAIFRSQ